MAPVQDELVEPDLADQRALLNRYVAAFAQADVKTLTREPLRQDATMEMPPWLTWLAGRDDIGRFLTRIFSLREADAWHMVPTSANGAARRCLCARCRRSASRAIVAGVHHNQHRDRSYRGVLRPESVPGVRSAFDLDRITGARAAGVPLGAPIS